MEPKYLLVDKHYFEEYNVYKLHLYNVETGKVVQIISPVTNTINLVKSGDVTINNPKREEIQEIEDALHPEQ